MKYVIKRIKVQNQYINTFQNDVVGRMCYEGGTDFTRLLSLLWDIETSVDNSQYIHQISLPNVIDR